MSKTRAVAAMLDDAEFRVELVTAYDDDKIRGGQ